MFVSDKIYLKTNIFMQEMKALGSDAGSLKCLSFLAIDVPRNWLMFVKSSRLETTEYLIEFELDNPENGFPEN